MELRKWPRVLQSVAQRSADLRAPKPLLRGWFHAAGAVGAVVATIGLIGETVADRRRLLAVLVFGLSMVALYTVSAAYHLGTWQGRRLAIMRALDHAGIFVLIAGTYTPICIIVLAGELGSVVLALIWSLAVVGVGFALLPHRLPHWVQGVHYVGMGWLALVILPRLAQVLPAPATAAFVVGGVLYTVGTVMLATRRPNPWPRFFGYHEIFHLFVIGGSAAFLIGIWGWVVPFAPG